MYTQTNTFKPFFWHTHLHDIIPCSIIYNWTPAFQKMTAECFIYINSPAPLRSDHVISSGQGPETEEPCSLQTRAFLYLPKPELLKPLPFSGKPAMFRWLFFFFFFFFSFISWRLITLQYCSGFCHTLT